MSLAVVRELLPRPLVPVLMKGESVCQRRHFVSGLFVLSVLV